jgi:hypothetical protein
MMARISFASGWRAAVGIPARRAPTIHRQSPWADDQEAESISPIRFLIALALVTLFGACSPASRGWTDTPAAVTSPHEQRYTDALANIPSELTSPSWTELP